MQYSIITYKGKDSEKIIYVYICIYTYKTESLCCTSEANNIVNQLYFDTKKLYCKK